MIPGGWHLMSGSNVVATGPLAEVLAEGELRGLITSERYAASRTGDDVTRRRLQPGIWIVPAAGQRGWRHAGPPARPVEADTDWYSIPF